MEKATRKLAQTEASINGYLDAVELDNRTDVIGKSYVVEMLRSLLMLVNEAQAEVKIISSKQPVIKSLPLDFVKWYSGIEQEKILRAYKRWKKESGNVL